MQHHFQHASELPVGAHEAFDWHRRPGAFERLSPPWKRVEVVERSGTIGHGDGLTLRLWSGPFPLRWTLRHEGYEEGRRFRDVQVAGPFAHWRHEHRFEPLGESRCRLEEEIHFRMPLGDLGAGKVRGDLERLFRFRHRRTRQDLEMHGRWSREPLRVAVTGASGLVGSALVHLLATGGHEVIRLGRPGSDSSVADALWSPQRGLLDPGALGRLDAVVHLAGESIAQGRWSSVKKERIRASRVGGTRRLVESLLALPEPPRTLVCASAVGYYGDRGEEILDEGSEAGSDFLARVCRDGEAATRPARQAGMRVVRARFGVVLSPSGGALAKMLSLFRSGLGGRLGSGRQRFSWVSLDDAIGAILCALGDDRLQGAINVVSPRATTNAEFTRTLARVLGRPAVFPVPASALRLGLGEMADALLLASQHVRPARLEAVGYPFRDPELEAALGWMLGRPPAEREAPSTRRKVA